MPIRALLNRYEERERETERERENLQYYRFMTWRVSKKTMDFNHIPYNQVKVVSTQQSY